jgi:two-component system, LuxR family, response regulator FixJ
MGMVATRELNVELILLHHDADAISLLSEIATEYQTQLHVLADFQAAQQSTEQITAGCIVFDWTYFNHVGAEAVLRFTNEKPQFPLLLWSAQLDVSAIATACRSGVIDALRKPEDNELLRPRLEWARQLAADRANCLKRCRVTGELIQQLGVGDRNVLNLLLEGKTNKEISSRLACSQRTVESRRQRILRVLQVENAIELGKVMGTYETLQQITRSWRCR